MNADERFVPLVRPGPGPAPGPPLFQHIGIVGLGLVGGSIALAARQAWPSALVIGVDRNEVVEQAVVLHAIDVAASDLAIVSEADLVVLAAPVRENVRLLARLPEYIDKPVVVTDVGSTKRAIVEAAANLPPHMTFVGGHPLGGSTGTGIQAARADLFAGRSWLFTPPAPGDGEPESGVQEALRQLFEFAKALGAMPHTIDASRHDHLMAYISHLPQLLVSALMQVVGDAVGDEGLGLSGRGLRDTTRLAASPVDIWWDICASNADELGPAIDVLVEVLQRLRGNLDNREVIAEVFEAARRWRAALTDPRG
jgi:prephenate dehydrogenase